MSFRPATADDEDFFYYWRCRAEHDGQAGGWWNGTHTTPEEHHDWYAARLGRIRLLVWEYADRPAGCVRIDSNGEIAFHCNPLMAERMLRELGPLAIDYGGRLKAVVDYGDRAASKALRDAGFREYPVRFYAFKP